MPTAETRPLGDAVKEQASSFLNSLVNPEGARLERRLRKAQIALAQAAAEHLPELEGTGHYEHLTALLGRAQGLLELARAIETTPTEMIPTTPKAWESPEDASFLGRLSKGAAALLTQAGGWLKHAGGKLEAGRCWLEAAALLSEAGAILAGVYGVEAHYPSWAAGPMEEIRRTVRDLEDTQTGAGGVRPTEKVRARAQEMADKYGSSLTMENFKSVLDDAGGHTREAFIDFTVWGIRTFGTFGTFAALLGFSAILIGPFGLVLTAAVIYTYSKYRSEVDAQTGKPAEVTAEDVPPADSSPTPSADPVDVPRTPLPGAGPG